MITWRYTVKKTCPSDFKAFAEVLEKCKLMEILDEKYLTGTTADIHMIDRAELIDKTSES